MIGSAMTSYKRTRWVLPEVDSAAVERLAREAGLPRLVARLLVRRGITERNAAAAFLEPKYRDIYSPWLLPNMRAAALRIAAAVREKKKITLYGDYDVDGITGTTMLWHTLKEARADVDYYIPHRVDEGYGLNSEAVSSLADCGTQLLITIDCGCSAVEPIALARQRGIEVVVSDHHEFGATVPAANEIVHPRAPRGTADNDAGEYPNADLCGAGVAFKLCWAIAQTLCNADRVNEVYRNLLMEFAALAALGTIADVVPLTGENRILVKHGLGQLARTKMPGLTALIRAAGYGADTEDGEGGGGRALDCTAVGFGLAPRLNAAGRMDHAREAVELLTTATPERAREIAEWLERQNRDRQSTEKKMVEIARAAIEKRRADLGILEPVLVVADEAFHAGVVGIVASRIVDLYHRPTFVLSNNGTEVHGSARSVPGFQLHEAIENVRDLLVAGGGHAMAGGVKMAAGNLETFQSRLVAYGRARLTEDLLTPAMELDGVLRLEDCAVETIEAMERLSPFGRGNLRPKFVLENAAITAPPRRVGSTGTHLQLTIGQGQGRGGVRRAGRCIAFKMGALEPQLRVGTEVNLVVEPKADYFNGRGRVDLVVADIARCDGMAFEDERLEVLSR